MGQIEEFTNKYEELTKTFTETLANMEKKYEEEAAMTAQRHKKQIEQSHENFVKLQKMVDLNKIIEETLNS